MLAAFLVVATATAFIVMRGKPEAVQTPAANSFQTVKNLGPGSGTPTPLAKGSGGKGTPRIYQSEVRFYDVNNLPSSEAVLTTESVAAHGSAKILDTASPIDGKAKKQDRSESKEAWAFLCSRANEEAKWRIHPNPVKVQLSEDAPTPFELTAADIRKGRANGETLILQCVVCSKRETVGEIVAPDTLPSIIGASEVRTLRLNTPMAPSAVVLSINSTQVDSSRYISSSRLGLIEARIRNVPAGAYVYMVTQAFDQPNRWFSLLQPQNSLAGDRFVGTAVFGKPNDAPKKYWLTVVISHRRIKEAAAAKNGEAVAIPAADWDSKYAPMIQAISEAPVIVKRVNQKESAKITLNVDGAPTGYGALNGAPIPVTRHFNVFGQIDFPGQASESGYRVWFLIYPEAEFDQVVSGKAKGGGLQQEARIENSDWDLPWAALPKEGRYIVVAVLTQGTSTAPAYITDPSVKAVSQPQLVEWK